MCSILLSVLAGAGHPGSCQKVRKEEVHQGTVERFVAVLITSCINGVINVSLFLADFDRNCIINLVFSILSSSSSLIS